MASAACALASVRKLGLLSRLTSDQSCSGNWTRRRKASRIVELPQKPLVLVGEPHGRHRHLAYEPLKFGKNSWVDLDPFARNLKEHSAEIVIEDVVRSAHPRQDAGAECLEVIGR